jgi:hypothetical protein
MEEACLNVDSVLGRRLVNVSLITEVSKNLIASVFSYPVTPVCT